MQLNVHHFEALGAATQAPTVALLHGFGSSGKIDFLDTGLVAALRASGRSVLLIDLPAHGESPREFSAGEVETPALLATLASTLERCIPSGEIHLVGYSLGARLSWDLARFSERITRAFLGGLSPVDPFTGVTAAALERALAQDPSADPLAQLIAGMISAADQPTEALAKLIAGLASLPFDPSQTPPEVPLRFAAGSSDEMTEGIEALVAKAPGASLVRVPGDHHSALRSEEFRTAVLEFLAEEPPRRA